MQGIQILDEKRYPLPNLNNDPLFYFRWEHRATIAYRSKRYMIFLDNGIMSETKTFSQPNIYIEEITTGNLEAIHDDSLFKDLHRYANSKGFLVILPPIRKGNGNDIIG